MFCRGMRIDPSCTLEADARAVTSEGAVPTTDLPRYIVRIGADKPASQEQGKQKQVGAIMTTTATTLFAERKRIAELAGKYRLPAIYPQAQYVDALLQDLVTDVSAVQARAVRSIFFGGGTPTLLPPRDLTRVVATIDDVLATGAWRRHAGRSSVVT